MYEHDRTATILHHIACALADETKHDDSDLTDDVDAALTVTREWLLTLDGWERGTPLIRPETAGERIRSVRTRLIEAVTLVTRADAAATGGPGRTVGEELRNLERLLAQLADRSPRDKPAPARTEPQPTSRTTDTWDGRGVEELFEVARSFMAPALVEWRKFLASQKK